MMKRICFGMVFILLATLAVFGQTPITVPGSARPWTSCPGGLNSSTGASGQCSTGSSPVTIPVSTGTSYHFSYVSGTASIGDGTYNDPNGQVGTTGNAAGTSGFWVSPVPTPFYNHGLIGAWTDSIGTIVGTPFAIGTSPPALVAPAGAVYMSMGMNDGTYWGDNSGAWNMSYTVTPPPPSPTVSLLGTIQYANGVKFNGQLELTTTKSTVLNICANPVQVVPTTSTIKVVNGEVTLTDVYSTDCLQPHLAYIAKLRQSSDNAVVFEDNWYLPSTSTHEVDVGTLVATNYAAGVTVSLPLPIVSTPVGNQQIIQPVGTSLTVNYLTVLNPINGSVTSLAGTPTTCGSGQFAIGIANNGNAICASIGTGVITFNGRAGNVLPQSGDYSYSMISGTPTLRYQTAYSLGSPQSQHGGYDFSSNFVLSDESSPDATGVDLVNVGTSGTYSGGIQAITIDTKGRVTNVVVGSGGTNPCGGFLGTTCTYDASGIVTQLGIADSSSSTASISFPVTFPHAITSVTFGTGNFGTNASRNVCYLASAPTTTSMVVKTDASTVHCYWTAIGN